MKKVLLLTAIPGIPAALMVLLLAGGVEVCTASLDIFGCGFQYFFAMLLAVAATVVTFVVGSFILFLRWAESR